MMDHRPLSIVATCLYIWYTISLKAGVGSLMDRQIYIHHHINWGSKREPGVSGRRASPGAQKHLALSPFPLWLSTKNEVLSVYQVGSLGKSHFGRAFDVTEVERLQTEGEHRSPVSGLAKGGTP